MNARDSFIKGKIEAIDMGFGYALVLRPNSGGKLVNLPQFVEEYIGEEVTIEIKVIHGPKETTPA